MATEIELNEGLETDLIFDQDYTPSEIKDVGPEPVYRQNIRGIVRTLYDIQKLRIATGGRVFKLFCNRFEIDLTTPEGKEKGKTLIDEIRKSYYRIIDGMNASLATTSKVKKKDRTSLMKNLDSLLFPTSEVIQNINEMVLVDQYEDLLQNETKHIKYLDTVLKSVPLYSLYLTGIKGIGPCMAGVLISEINIYKSKYSSSIHMYAGLDVAPDGQGRSKRKEHLINVKYTNSKGEEDTRVSITYNPFLKSKLMGVLSGSFLRQKNPKYVKIYNDYKHRLQNREDLKDYSKGHIHNMSLRYMVKQFLNELYENWRSIEGLPVHDPYAVAKLGHNPHNSPSTT